MSDRVKDIMNSVKDVHLYMDDATGNVYIFDGTKLVQVGSSSKDGDKDKNKGPQIGDKPKEGELDAEEAERQAQIEKEKAEAEANGEEWEEETEEERQQRLDDIKNMLGDEVTKDEIENETASKVDKDREKRLAKEKAQRKKEKEDARSPMSKFQESLNRFISYQVRREKNKTWKMSNMSYEGSGVMRRGKMTTNSKHIPKINVYFDQSMSWGDSDVRRGMEAIGILNNYVKRGEIEIEVFYFANHVHTDVELAREEGGTHAGKELLEHINETRPDNIIIMTDDDVDYQSGSTGPTSDGPSTIVPGAVWFLFKEESVVLQKKLHGRQQTLKFNIRGAI